MRLTTIPRLSSRSLRNRQPKWFLVPRTASQTLTIRPRSPLSPPTSGKTSNNHTTHCMHAYIEREREILVWLTGQISPGFFCYGCRPTARDTCLSTRLAGLITRKHENAGAQLLCVLMSRTTEVGQGHLTRPTCRETPSSDYKDLCVCVCKNHQSSSE
jgi:hypothetical protein